LREQRKHWTYKKIIKKNSLDVATTRKDRNLLDALLRFNCKEQISKTIMMGEIFVLFLLSQLLQ
jgi:hypothetical protein